jgi:hypothetical protein
MQSQLASWKNKILNKPGRLTLAAFILTSIDNIDQMTGNFIWRDSNNKGIHLVS